MIFVDSNMWCYYFDQRLPEHERVLEPMREILKSQEIACNTIIVMEVAHYLVRHFSEKASRKKIDYFINLRNMKIADFNRPLMTQTIDALLEYAYDEGLGGRDATIIATLKSLNIKKLVSHDDIFKRLTNKLEIELMDPAQTTPT